MLLPLLLLRAAWAQCVKSRHGGVMVMVMAMVLLWGGVSKTGTDYDCWILARSSFSSFDGAESSIFWLSLSLLPATNRTMFLQKGPKERQRPASIGHKIAQAPVSALFLFFPLNGHVLARATERPEA